MSEWLKVGDTVIALQDSPFPDCVTKGKEYKVASVWTSTYGGTGFNIINDNNLEAMPVEAGFYRKGEENE